jgi:hypothetical protein
MEERSIELGIQIPEQITYAAEHVSASVRLIPEYVYRQLGDHL